MEYVPIIDRRSPIKVSIELKHTLLEFTMSCLMNQPDAVVPYAQEYFDHLMTGHTIIEKSFVSEEEEEDEVVMPQEDFPPEAMEYTRTRGKVVYSEPYNPETDTTDDEEDVVYEKTPQQREMLLNVVTKCLLFRSLDKEQINRVIDVMIPKEVETGDIVIKQFDDGDFFYIIEFGLFDVLIAEEPGAEAHHVFTYPNAGSFGELALMYNMPRAATIRAGSKGRLWAMDRQTFRRIVLKAAFRKRKMYEALIAKVPLLQELTPYERMNVADALVPRIYNDGDIIIKQHDKADGMHFIEKGEVIVYVIDPECNEDVEVNRATEGGYFGELALITHKPRAATIKAKGEVKVAFLDVDAFERLLGPCLDIMERNISTYNLQVQKILLGRSAKLRN